MRVVKLAVLASLFFVAANARAQEEWKPPASGEVREIAVQAFVAALERARNEGFSIGPTATKSLTWIGPYGSSPSGMDEETIAAIQSSGVPPEEVAWTAEKVLEVMRLHHIARTPIPTLAKQEKELAAELARRAAAAKAAFPKDSTWAKGVDRVVSFAEKSVELLRGRDAPTDDVELAKQQSMRSLGGLTVLLRLQTLRSAANELEAVPARALDLLDELEEARSAHAEAARLLELGVLGAAARMLAELPKKNVAAGEAVDERLRAVLVALGWKPFTPAIVSKSEPHRLTAAEVDGFLKFVASLRGQAYSLAEVPPRGALGPVDLSGLDPGNEVDEKAVQASGMDREELFTAGNRVMDLLVAIVTGRTPVETWQKRIDEAKAATEKARAELDAKHPDAERQKLTKAFVENGEKKKAALDKLRAAYEKELAEAGKAFETDTIADSPTEGSWQELMKGERDLIEATFAGLPLEMEFWSYIGERRTGRNCPPAERKALEALHAQGDRRAMLEVFARSAKQGPTLIAHATKAEMAALEARLPELEKLFQAMESPLYGK